MLDRKDDFDPPPTIRVITPLRGKWVSTGFDPNRSFPMRCRYPYIVKKGKLYFAKNKITLAQYLGTDRVTLADLFANPISARV